MTTLLTYEEIDRAIYEQLRLAVVAAGFLPDITLYNTQNAWIAARNALRTSLPDGQLIDVFGVGAADDRDEYTLSKFIINRTDETNGNIAAGGYEWERNGNVFKEQYTPQYSTDITYEVLFNAPNTRYERIMSNIMNATFSKIKQLSACNEDGTFDQTKKFYIKLFQKFDNSVAQYTQKTYIFRVEAVFLLTETTSIIENISSITSIDFKIYAHAASEMPQ